MICPECYRRNLVEREMEKDIDAILRILIERLGGKVEITDEEFHQARLAGWRSFALVEVDEESGTRVLRVKTH